MFLLENKNCVCLVLLNFALYSMHCIGPGHSRIQVLASSLDPDPAKLFRSGTCEYYLDPDVRRNGDAGSANKSKLLKKLKIKKLN